MNDDWNVMGLKGTGSVSYSVKDLFVPDDFSFTRESDADRREAGPLYRFSMFNMFGVGFSGVALGIARRALDDFIKLAMTKKPYARDDAALRQQHHPVAGRIVGSAAAVVAHLRDRDLPQALSQRSAQGLRFTQEMRIANRIVTCYAIQQAREVMNFVYHAAGATAIFESNPFERRFRDLNTVTQQGQGAVSPTSRMLGQTLMGRPARQT